MTIHRLIVRAFSGPKQLVIEAMPESLPPRPGRVLVDVEAAGVNYLDVYQRKVLPPIDVDRPNRIDTVKMAPLATIPARLARGTRQTMRLNDDSE
jgi:NADPH:quinone reductase-like Zn-dependent oxidoreductase